MELALSQLQVVLNNYYTFPTPNINDPTIRATFTIPYRLKFWLNDILMYQSPATLPAFTINGFDNRYESNKAYRIDMGETWKPSRADILFGNNLAIEFYGAGGGGGYADDYGIPEPRPYAQDPYAGGGAGGDARVTSSSEYNEVPSSNTKIEWVSGGQGGTWKNDGSDVYWNYTDDTGTVIPVGISGYETKGLGNTGNNSAPGGFGGASITRTLRNNQILNSAPSISSPARDSEGRPVAGGGGGSSAVNGQNGYADQTPGVTINQGGAGGEGYTYTLIDGTSVANVNEGGRGISTTETQNQLRLPRPPAAGGHGSRNNLNGEANGGNAVVFVRVRRI